MVFHGVNVNWGVQTEIQYASGLFQTRDHKYSANSELVTDGGETPVSKVYWADYEEATFTYVCTDFTEVGGDGGFSSTNSPDVGDWVNVTDANYPEIEGMWLTDEVTVHSANVNATRISLRLTRYPNVDSSYG